MKRTFFLIALTVLGALPAMAQTNELGVLIGGSRRFVDAAKREPGVEFRDSTFSLSNNSFDIFWAVRIEEDGYLKFRAGRIETDLGVAYELPTGTDGKNETYRRDTSGEVQHVTANIEYRFSEPWGSTGLVGGLGFYRLSPEDEDSETSFGFNAGVTADFPLSRRYGVLLDATYHFAGGELQQRFLTASAGLRVSF
jgi:hypothetical protein